ncbi:MAG: Phenylalanyl-tRNA synthetase beta chain, partial [Gemmatimonadetes bacterium]|nr:Phenylalanyl-tRNA synthetase beta chain [Gemmatimonadota bacterium]
RHVVCGASNVTAGRKYPFIRVGSLLPGGLKIEKRKIRGEVSEGMLCSARELALGDEHDGILELDVAAEPGTPFMQAWDLGDHRLVLDVTPNRPDLLGHKGVARELAAAYGVAYRLPRLPGEPVDLPAIQRAAARGRTGEVEVAIEDAWGCARFLGAVVRGVRVGPSPVWLKRRLEAVGARSVNNVVDATNYVLFELGQPLHAYDLATLRGAVVLARPARDGERLVTLDGVDRAVPTGATVIADRDRVIGIAGVMGGAETEVTDATTDLFLECAWFAPSGVRATRKAVGLSTEASYRFERGVDRWNGAEALRRCLEVILKVAGGAVADTPVDCWPEPAHPPRVFLRRHRVAQVLGVDLPLHQIEQALVAIGATVVAKPDDERLAVEVPGWRPDLVGEIDLVEEVARQYGYDRIPSDLRPFRMANQLDAPAERIVERVRQGLIAQGLFETMTLSLGPEDPEGAVRLANPLSADHAWLRRRLLPGLVREAERNWAARTRDIRLFEIGTGFEPAAPGTRPHETVRVAAVLAGAREPGHWTGSGKAPDVDHWDLAAVLELTRDLANPEATVQVEGNGWRLRGPDGRSIGWAGPLGADAPRWAAPLFGLELELVAHTPRALAYRPVPTTPAVDRDLALVLPEAVLVATVLEAVRNLGGTDLESVAVVDEYRGAGVPDGARSVAIRLTFRSADRTLRDVEVDQVIERVRSALAAGRSRAGRPQGAGRDAGRAGADPGAPADRGPGA